MATTHALVGMALALPVAYATPEFAPVALVSGSIGGLVPDLDLSVDHRKTLHFPVYYSAAATLAAIVALVMPTQATVGLAVFSLAAAVHSIMDAFGGDLQLRPWLGAGNRAVYNHYRGRWIAPRWWVRYDGAPEDLLLAVAVATVLWPAVDEPMRWLIAVLIGISVVYAVMRKRLVRVRERLVPWVPDPIRVWWFGRDERS